MSKQLSVCSVVVTRLNSQMPENAKGAVIFDESVAERCMELSTKGTSVDDITIFIEVPFVLFLFSKFDGLHNYSCYHFLKTDELNVVLSTNQRQA